MHQPHTKTHMKKSSKATRHHTSAHHQTASTSHIPKLILKNHQRQHRNITYQSSYTQFITTTHIPKLIQEIITGNTKTKSSQAILRQNHQHQSSYKKSSQPTTPCTPPLHFQQHLRTASNLKHNKAKILATDHNTDTAKKHNSKATSKKAQQPTTAQKSITAKQQTKSRTAEQASKKPNSKATDKTTHKFELRHCPLKRKNIEQFPEQYQNP